MSRVWTYSDENFSLTFKEAAIIILDVSSYMEKGNRMEVALKYVTQYFQKRVLIWLFNLYMCIYLFQIASGVSDQVSIILFGSSDTNNELANEKVSLLFF